jgi:hypothetical protein
MSDVIEIFADGTTIERDFTEAELEQIEKDKTAELAKQAQAEAKAQAKVAAESKLAALGLTMDDLRALGL